MTAPPVNRSDLRKLALMRLGEADVLLQAGKPSGAYYLAGYAVECALKACIAKQFKKSEFPDKRTVVDSYTHDLSRLVKLGGLEPALYALTAADPIAETFWAVVKDWSEESRYFVQSALKARDLVEAVSDPAHGILRWIRTYW